MGKQWLHRVAPASSSGCRQPRHCTFFLAKRMMPLLATEGVDIAMDRVCSPAGSKYALTLQRGRLRQRALNLNTWAYALAGLRILLAFKRTSFY